MNNKKAFTLIELLVVVLIIGILAAVALPQYRVAVGKAKIMRLVPMMRSIEKAQLAYRLANGKYSTNFSELDIDIPAGGNVNTAANYVTYADFKCQIKVSGSSLACGEGIDSSEHKLHLELYHDTTMFCWAYNETDKAICKSICQKNPTPQDNGFSVCRF